MQVLEAATPIQPLMTGPSGETEAGKYWRRPDAGKYYREPEAGRRAAPSPEAGRTWGGR
jgi:hypothetical protein